MKIKFKNYIIEDDRNGFILSILGVKGEESKNEGEEYMKEQIYPSTLQLCFEKIFKIEKMNIKEQCTIQEYIKKLGKMQKDFLEEMSLILK